MRKNSQTEFAKLKRFVRKGGSFFGMVNPKCPLNFGLWVSNGEVKNMNSKMKGTFILGLILVAAFASVFVLSASAADQTRDRVKDQVQDCDCTNDCACDGTPDQTRDRIQDQTQDCDGTPDQTQDRARNRDCTATFVKDQTQLQLRQQIRDC